MLFPQMEVFSERDFGLLVLSQFWFCVLPKLRIRLKPNRSRPSHYKHPFRTIQVRSAFGGKKQYDLFDKYKDEILFIGISSFEDFPLPSVNPFSGKYPANEYVGRFDGFLHMMREPEKFFPPHVKLLLMSQSDFR